MRWRIVTAAVAVALVAAACSGGSDGETSDENAASTGPDTTVSTVELTASTEAEPATSSSGSTASSGSTTADPTTSESTATSTSPPSTATTSAPQPTLLDGGDSYAFTSPSGNIACVMSSSFGASCWIGDKSWTIEQPDGPFCDESDWGDAVDVGVDGPTFPCYTDFSWDPNAAALEYGQAVQVGAFRCESAENGVTCSNGAGSGFLVRRASVDLF